MELLILLGFLTGWFVCWIQMSKSESRQVQKLRSEILLFQKSEMEKAMAREWDLQ